MNTESSSHERPDVTKARFGRAPEAAAINMDFMQVTVAHRLGDSWSRPAWAIEDRSLITIAASTVAGRENELKTHLCGAKHPGFSRKKIAGIMLDVAHSGG